MASSKRRPDKDKRYRENKARREARAARSAHAGEATAISRGEREPVAAKPDTTAPAARGGKRPKRESPWKIPGQRAVVLAFLFTLVSAVTLLVAPIQVRRDIPATVTDGVVVVEDEQFADEDFEPDDVSDEGTVEVFDDGKLFEEEDVGIALMIVLVPILITGAAAWFTKRPQRSTAWTFAMLAMAGYIFFLAGPYGVIALPSLVALAVGNFQSKRAENKVRMAQIKAEREARAEGGDGEVIDVDAVEDIEPVDADADTDSDTETDADTTR